MLDRDLSSRKSCFSRPHRGRRARQSRLIAKDGEQVFEIWLNNGDVYARTTEQDLDHEGFRKLGLRICASDEELKKFDNPKRLQECVKT